MVTFTFFRAKRAIALLAAVSLPLVAALPASAALIAVDLTGFSGNEATQVFSNPSPQFTSVTLSRVGLNPAPLDNGFGASNWLNVFDASRYIQIDIVPGAGISYDITSINLRIAASLDTWTLRMASSVDGFATPQTLYTGPLSNPTTFVATPGWGSAQTGPTSFRLYAQSTSGFSNQSAGLTSASPAIEFIGSAVPEPASATLFAGSLLMLTFRRRR